MKLNPELLEMLACPMCKSDVIFKDGKLSCADGRCDLDFPVVDGVPVMLPSNLANDLELTKRKWDEEYENHPDLSEVDLMNIPGLDDLYNHVKKHMDAEPREGFFLESGCGSSKLLCLLAKDGVKTVGLDLSLNGLIFAKRLFKREGVDGLFVCGDMLNMPFKDDAFNFLFSAGVVEHFKDTQKAVDEVYRCLVLGGSTSHTVPCASLSAFYRVLRWGNIPDIPVIKELVELVEVKIFKGKFMRFGYEKSFAPGKLKKIFRNAGFKNVGAGFFKTYYLLDWAKSDFLRKTLTKIANTRLFWPMIYVKGEK